MADKSIDQLNAAEKIYATDLFVLQQSGSAKKLTGQVLINWLTAAADGHGGIQSIEKLSTSVLADTYRITLADTTTFDFVVNNGRGITDISKTATSGLVDTYTISYNNGTTSKFTVTNGAKGDKGDNAYMWIKYASQEPTESSHSMGDIPDDWIGIYSGNSSTAPTDWKQYQWFEIKGEKGDIGVPATLVNKSVTYQVSDSGSIIPSGSWVNSVPVVPQGKYLWTKTEVQFNTGDPITWYSVAYAGINGTGAVSTVAGISPDESGNVLLSAADVGARPNTWTPTASEVGAIPSTDGAVATSNIADGAVSAGKIASGAVTRAKLAADVKVISFTNKTVATSSWASDTTYPDFPYRASVACSGVTANHYADVSFSPADVLEGIFCPIAVSYTGGVYIYASEKPSATVTIPTIVCTPIA